MLRVEELGGDLRFAIEALARLFLVLEVGDDHLERDLSIHRLVVRGEDEARGAAADPLEQAVATQALDVDARGGAGLHRSAS